MQGPGILVMLMLFHQGSTDHSCQETPDIIRNNPIFYGIKDMPCFSSRPMCSWGVFTGISTSIDNDPVIIGGYNIISHFITLLFKALNELTLATHESSKPYFFPDNFGCCFTSFL